MTLGENNQGARVRQEVGVIEIKGFRGVTSIDLTFKIALVFSLLLSVSFTNQRQPLLLSNNTPGGSILLGEPRCLNL